MAEIEVSKSKSHVKALAIGFEDVSAIKHLSGLVPGRCYKIAPTPEQKPFLNHFGEAGYALNMRGIRIATKINQS